MVTQHVPPIKLEFNPDRDFYSSILITAFDGNYGGCWYWAYPAGDGWLQTTGSGLDALWERCTIKSNDPLGSPSLDALNEQGFIVSHSVLAQGIQVILEEGKINDSLADQIRRGVAENEPDIDADAADCIVQVGLFGELIFG